MSLNLFGSENSFVKLFKPQTGMGKKLIRGRINQPTCCPEKLEKWYNNLRGFISAI
jgi:hypothetical protein